MGYPADEAWLKVPPAHHSVLQMSFPLAMTTGRHHYVMELPVPAEWSDSTAMTRWHSHPPMLQHSENQTGGMKRTLIKQNKQINYTKR